MTNPYEKYVCTHDAQYSECNHCLFQRKKTDRCIHQVDESCYHCRINDPNLVKGIDPNSVQKQTTTDYPAGIIWVENSAIIHQLNAAYSKLRYSAGFWDDADWIEPDLERQREAEIEIAEILTYIRMADRIKNEEWERGKFK